jgi:hypothetical protein
MAVATMPGEGAVMKASAKLAFAASSADLKPSISARLASGATYSTGPIAIGGSKLLTAVRPAMVWRLASANWG